MKKYLCFIIVCLMIFCLLSCDKIDGNDVTTNINMVTTNINTETTKNHDWVSKNMSECDFFDFSKTHKSSDEDMKHIEFDMNLKKVIDIIGKPHDYGPTSGVMSLEWETIEGNIYWISIYNVREPAPDESLFYNIYEYSTVLWVSLVDSDISSSKDMRE